MNKLPKVNYPVLTVDELKSLPINSIVKVDDADDRLFEVSGRGFFQTLQSGVRLKTSEELLKEFGEVELVYIAK